MLSTDEKLKKLSWKFKESYKAYTENQLLRPFVNLKKKSIISKLANICSKT